MVAAEIVILFSGVVARYVFNAPLVWSDELASILFLWLAMLGAVVAFRRDEHMRMTACVGMLSAQPRAMLDMFATGAALAFLLLIAWPACNYALEEVSITTPALQIANVWRAAALPVGTVLMALFAVLRLANSGSPRTLVLPLGAVAAICVLFWLGEPLFHRLGNLNLLIFFVGVVAATVFAGVPIAFAFGLAVFGYLALTTSTPLLVLVGRMDEGMSHIILLAVPLFVFLGLLIEMTGMARAMVDFPGEPAWAMCAADCNTSWSPACIWYPEFPVRRPQTWRRSRRSCFRRCGARCKTRRTCRAIVRDRRPDRNNSAEPRADHHRIGDGRVDRGAVHRRRFTGDRARDPALLVVRRRCRGEDLGEVKRASKREIGRTFLIALPAIVLPFLIRASVVEGIATATEVSTIGIAYAALAGLLIYRRFEWSALKPMLIHTASLSGAILLIIGTATGMAWGLTQSGFSRSLAAAMTGLPGGAVTFMAVSIAAFIVLGSLLEGIPAIVLFGPLLFPIARAVGIHEVHYAMVVILAMGIGLFAPPFGVGYYAACAIARVAPAEGMRPILGYMVALVIGTAIVAAVPWLSVGFLK